MGVATMKNIMKFPQKIKDREFPSCHSGNESD